MLKKNIIPVLKKYLVKMKMFIQWHLQKSYRITGTRDGNSLRLYEPVTYSVVDPKIIFDINF